MPWVSFEATIDPHQLVLDNYNSELLSQLSCIMDVAETPNVHIRFGTNDQEKADLLMALRNRRAVSDNESADMIDRTICVLFEIMGGGFPFWFLGRKPIRTNTSIPGLELFELGHLIRKRSHSMRIRDMITTISKSLDSKLRVKRGIMPAASLYYTLYAKKKGSTGYEPVLPQVTRDQKESTMDLLHLKPAELNLTDDQLNHLLLDYDAACRAKDEEIAALCAENDMLSSQRVPEPGKSALPVDLLVKIAAYLSPGSRSLLQFALPSREMFAKVAPRLFSGIHVDAFFKSCHWPEYSFESPEAPSGRLSTWHDKVRYVKEVRLSFKHGKEVDTPLSVLGKSAATACSSLQALKTPIVGGYFGRLGWDREFRFRPGYLSTLTNLDIFLYPKAVDWRLDESPIPFTLPNLQRLTVRGILRTSESLEHITLSAKDRREFAFVGTVYYNYHLPLSAEFCDLVRV